MRGPATGRRSSRQRNRRSRIVAERARDLHRWRGRRTFVTAFLHDSLVTQSETEAHQRLVIMVRIMLFNGPFGEEARRQG